MNKFKDFMVWVLGEIIIIALFVLGIKIKIGFLIAISVLAFIFFQMIVIAALVQSKDDKKESIKREEYTQKYLSSFEYNSDKIGKIIFEKDDNKNTLNYSGIINNLNFNGKQIEINIDIEQNNNLNKIVDNLVTFCNGSDKLLDRIYNEFIELLKNTDNYDKDGNLIEITEQFLRDNLEFRSLEISRYYLSNVENQVGIYCYWESSGNQDYIINYNTDTDELDFELL